MERENDVRCTSIDCEIVDLIHSKTTFGKNEIVEARVWR